MINFGIVKIKLKPRFDHNTSEVADKNYMEIYSPNEKKPNLLTEEEIECQIQLIKEKTIDLLNDIRNFKIGIWEMSPGEIEDRLKEYKTKKTNLSIDYYFKYEIYCNEDDIKNMNEMIEQINLILENIKLTQR